MSGAKRKRKKLLTDEQIQERIGNTLEGPQKANYLTFAVFAIPFYALTLVVSVPAEFRKTAVAWALAHGIVNLIWTIVAGFGWRTLPYWESKRLSKEERHHRLRLQTIWFRFWKGGFLLLFSTLTLLIGLGMLKHLRPMGWMDGLAVGVYGLAYAFSFWQRRRICHVRVEGYSPDTRWGRLMLRLAVIGPATAAATCSAITSVLARLHIVPKSVVAGFFGTLAIVLASIMVPQIVYDFTAAWIHLRIHRE